MEMCSGIHVALSSDQSQPGDLSLLICLQGQGSATALLLSVQVVKSAVKLAAISLHAHHTLHATEAPKQMWCKGRLACTSRHHKQASQE